MLIFDGLQPYYVFDKMEMYELKPLVENHFLRAKENWEQTRLLAFITAQCNSTKPLKMTDIVSFPWDEKPEGKKEKPKDTLITQADEERLRRNAEFLKQYL